MGINVNSKRTEMLIPVKHKLRTKENRNVPFDVTASLVNPFPTFLQKKVHSHQISTPSFLSRKEHTQDN